MSSLDFDERELVLDVYRSEIKDLQTEYDGYLATGLIHLDKGDIREANVMLMKIASVERRLTYIKSCLESEYKQVVSLH